MTSEIVAKQEFEVDMTTTHIGSLHDQWINDSQILTVEAGKIS